MDIYLVILITLVAALIASLAQLLFKRGLTKKLGSISDFIALLRNRNIMVGIVGYFASLAIYLYALGNGPLSFVYPIFASTFIFVFLVSTFMLHEKFSVRRASGVLLVFLGILIVGGSL